MSGIYDTIIGDNPTWSNEAQQARDDAKQYAADANNSANVAKSSADTAKQSSTEAAASADTTKKNATIASQSATEAAASASAASVQANAANASADAAKKAVDDFTGSVDEAKQYAANSLASSNISYDHSVEAKASASSAKTSETNASTSASSASKSATVATTGANTASTAATTATDAMKVAQTSATTATTAASTAQSAQEDTSKYAATVASQASQVSSDASTVAQNTADVKAAVVTANTAKDWAIKLDAPVSDGEYSAKYWAQQTRANVTGGVISFNNRSGVVVPADGDYSVTQITGAAPLDSPNFTGEPRLVTVPATSDNSRRLATTGWVQSNLSTKATVASVSSKANIYSPTFTGSPKAPTVASTDKSTAIATTAFVQSLLATVPTGEYAEFTGTDLDSITTNSKYYVVSGSKVANCPASSACFVETVNAFGVLRQTVTAYEYDDSNDGGSMLAFVESTIPIIYVRFNATLGWGLWRMMSNVHQNKPPVFRLENGSTPILQNSVEQQFTTTNLIIANGFTNPNDISGVKVPVSGIYQLSAGFACTKAYSGAVITEPKNINILVNNASRLFMETHGAQNSDGRGSWKGSGLTALTAGDVLTVKFSQWTQQPMTLVRGPQTFFEGFLVRNYL